MEVSTLVRDNIDEVLVKIIQFTHICRKVILDNINNCHLAGFIPRKVDVEDFAKVISAALCEHQASKRLALCDSDSVSFLPDGKLNVRLQIDSEAKKLFDQDFGRYLYLQEQRLSENTVNNKTACALLEHKLKLAKVTV